MENKDRIFLIIIITIVWIISFFIGMVLGMIIYDGIKPQQNYENLAPHDWIKYEQIYTNSKGVFIKIQNPIIAEFKDTKSMLPTFSSKSYGIEIIPKSGDDIHVGDIASYKYGNETIIHRVIEIGQDEDGWYAIFKGDNNKNPDPYKVRSDQIQRVLVGVLF